MKKHIQMSKSLQHVVAAPASHLSLSLYTNYLLYFIIDRFMSKASTDEQLLAIITLNKINDGISDFQWL